MLLLFYYLALLQNDSLVPSRCVQFTFGDKREVTMLDESALPEMKKKDARGKKQYAVTKIPKW